MIRPNHTRLAATKSHPRSPIAYVTGTPPLTPSPPLSTSPIHIPIHSSTYPPPPPHSLHLPVSNPFFSQPSNSCSNLAPASLSFTCNEEILWVVNFTHALCRWKIRIMKTCRKLWFFQNKTICQILNSLDQSWSLEIYTRN